MKKLLLFLLFSVPIRALCQCEYVINEVDEFEKLEKVLTKPAAIYSNQKTGGQVFMALMRVDTLYKIVISPTTKNMICFNSESRALIMFSDSSILRLAYYGDIECSKRAKSGYYSMSPIFDLTKDALLSSKAKSVLKIRVYTSKETIEFNLTEQNKAKHQGSTFFSETVDCVLKK